MRAQEEGRTGAVTPGGPERAGALPRLRHTRNFVVWGEDLIAYLRSVSRTTEDGAP